MRKAGQRAIQLRQAERDKKVLALVRAGATFQQIADTLGMFDSSAASKAWRDALRRAGPAEVDVKHARARHADRLASLWRVAYAKAIGETDVVGNFIVQPDPKWFENARKTLADIMEFEGTSAPKQVRVSGQPGGAPIALTAVPYSEITEMTDEQLVEARAALEQAAATHTAPEGAPEAGSGSGASPEGTRDEGGESGTAD